MADTRSMELSYVFLYGTSVLMEEFSTTPTVSLTGQLMVGLWMLACVILTNGYRSSLAANLIIQEKMPAINSFEDLLARDTWGWGSSFVNDSTMDFYRYNPSSGIQDIYKGMQASDQPGM
ncbi:uncharacterized protein [Panulirus ornatus]|uniref:uncharacterized protein n=1 Tax=Panulirus ornatus TaxID=150431 RepID=UPI003A868D2E